MSDPDSGNSQKHQESRDGDSVKGEYSLIEPDGYIRRVIYSADPTHGFQATVIYEPPAGALTSSPKASAAYNVYPKPGKITNEFPYEEIINSIPDVHDIPIPHYDHVEPLPSQYNSEPGNNQYDHDDKIYDSPGHFPYEEGGDGNLYDSSNLVRSNANILEPKFYEDTNSLRGLPEVDNNLYEEKNNLYQSENIRSESFNIEELPSTRAYDSTEVTNINNMYEPQAETTSAEYDPLYA